MIKLGEKSEDGPSTRQKVLTRCMWLLGTCRNAIVVVATGVLGYWFVATHGAAPVRLMGSYTATHYFKLMRITPAYRCGVFRAQEQNRLNIFSITYIKGIYVVQDCKNYIIIIHITLTYRKMINRLTFCISLCIRQLRMWECTERVSNKHDTIRFRASLT